MNVRTQSARAHAHSRASLNALARLARAGLAAAALLLLPATATAQVLTIGNAGTGEAASNLMPGAGKIALDAFTLTATVSTASVTSLTVTMPAGSAALVERLTIEDTSTCTMATPYGTALNPATDTVAIAPLAISVTTGAARPYWVCVKPRAATAMPAVPGGAPVAVTGRVTAAVAAPHTVPATADVVSPARTIDNQSPGPVTAASGVAGNQQVGLTWTRPVDADFREVVVLYKTSAITDVPVEGVAYQPFTFNQVAGVYQRTLVGTSSVGYVGSANTVSIGSGDVANRLTNGTPYYFKIFAKDSNGNYSLVGASVGPSPRSAPPTRPPSAAARRAPTWRWPPAAPSPTWTPSSSSPRRGPTP